ncbi:Ldh family oxidoreductase [Streptomyces platensis]|uniref:Ldh family oxidoreductase n=1 Tax=Streptomyces platensis TaxID=58346 RepID=UPI0033236B87
MTQPAATDSAVLSASWLTGAVQQIFLALDYSLSAAQTVAESLVDADLRGVTSHGALLVPMYVERIQHGSVSRAESAEVLHDFGAVATLDAHHGLGQLSGDQAMRMAIDKARSFGIGAVAVRNAFHFGAAFRYADAAAEAGCLGVAAANTRPLMPAPGGARPIVGNNPLAVAVPLPDRPNIVLDMALSEAALGKVRLAAQEGRTIPATWATDVMGEPTTDPVAALEGMLLPTGGPKGYGLALMVDVLTGVLSGGAFGAGVRGLYADTTVPNNCAHFFLAIDPAAFGVAEEFACNALRLADEIEASPTKPGTERVYLPGQLEHERAATATRAGIHIDGGVLNALHKTAKSLHVELKSVST